MHITGHSLIGARDAGAPEGGFQAVDPRTRQPLPGRFASASADEVDAACRLAADAFDDYRSRPMAERAAFLEEIARGIEALGPALVERAVAETGLPVARIEGERGRTTGQLRLFAGLLRSGTWQQLALDTPLPARQPLPRADLRQRRVPLGPVAVFGASNFPLAFSTAGGDTASALAAGCPVVVRAHPSHPGTAELVGRALRDAVQRCGLPEGVFSQLGGEGHAVGAALVGHPAIQAVGFTGSRSGGLALTRLAQARPQPIPVYAEMSSVNPVFLMPAAAAARAEAIAAGFVDSLALGSGQFCTNPGLVFGIAGAPWRRFVDAVAAAAAPRPAGTLLNDGIHRAYLDGTRRLAAHEGVRTVAQGQAAADGACAAQLQVHETDARRWLVSPALHDEVFGPSSLLVRCDDLGQLQAAAEQLEGQLTATLQVDPADHADAGRLLRVLERKAGRILANGFPTGVEVGHAMVHGGPWPATTDSRSTSVGTFAIDRFLRPVCYQDLPEGLWPAELGTDALNAAWRTVDGLPLAPMRPQARIDDDAKDRRGRG